MKRCCLNCQGFAYWAGDYCCVPHLKIHQFGYPNGIWFNEDIDNTMQTPETCEEYDYAHHETYPESENPYIKEYLKFKEWKKLCKQLEEHVK